MIRYTLRCDAGHAFEGWFRGSDDFDTQCARGLVTCPTCGSAAVDKALMAPAVATARARAARAERPEPAARPDTPEPAVPDTDRTPASAPAAPPQVALPPPEAVRAQVIAQLRALKTELMAKAEDVGTAFPEEARKIHYGEAEERGIYGAASREEVAELLDEGIEILPLPVLPDEHN